ACVSLAARSAGASTLAALLQGEPPRDPCRLVRSGARRTAARETAPHRALRDDRHRLAVRGGPPYCRLGARHDPAHPRGARPVAASATHEPHGSWLDRLTTAAEAPNWPLVHCGRAQVRCGF